MQVFDIIVKIYSLSILLFLSQVFLGMQADNPVYNRLSCPLDYSLSDNICLEHI